MDRPKEENPPEWVTRMREQGYVVSDVTCDALPLPVTFPDPDSQRPRTFDEWLEMTKDEPLEIIPAVTDTLPPPEFAFSVPEPAGFFARARDGMRKFWRCRSRRTLSAANAPLR